MNEIQRVISYIRSCREADIDCTVTIDKSKTHLLLNALEKNIPKRPVKIHFTKFSGSTKPNYMSGECPCCKSDVDTDSDANVCGKCGQQLEW